MKTILVTGGFGYIGEHLQEHFSSLGYTVLAPTHASLDLLETNSVASYFASHAVDVVVHCAVVGGSRKEEKVEDSLSKNLRMFFNIVRCHKYFKKMIHIGSGAEYDKRRALKKVREHDFDKYVPIDEYGFFKYICGKYIEESKLPIVNLRIFGLYGSGENYRLGFISNMIVRKILGAPFLVNQDVIFDYLYVKDFIRIVEYFIKHTPKYRSYNIGTGKAVHILSLAKQISSMFPSKLALNVAKTGLNKEYTCDTKRLMDELGKFTFTGMEKSLWQMYDWYSERKNSLSLDIKEQISNRK